MQQPVYPGAPSSVPLAELCEIAELEDEAKALAAAQQDPRAFIAALVEQERYADAVRLLAHALPTREAVWWAWFCAKRVTGEGPPAPARAALEATERWIAQPTEEHRRPAMELAQRAEIGTPAGCAALAVFFSGGSVAPPDAPPVPPAPYSASKAIAGSVILAAVSKEPEKAPEKFATFIERGMQVADRIQLWPPAAKPAL